MGKIVELPIHISNQIKAGEIVERPVSVVKELVENAIDANSSQIDIFIEEGGLSKIQVVDNGDGIDDTDAAVAFRRHATSKMTALIDHATVLSPDKMPIKTLGFRGEALPSIAAVSKVTMETSTGENVGTYLRIEGGQVVEQRATSVRKGTSMTVEHLFYNTPARLKFISSLQSEIAKIADLVNRLALSHPNIAFSLMVDNQRLLKTLGNGQLKQTIAGVYSPTIAKQMIAFEKENLRFKVSGFTSLPEVTRAKKSFISLFLNGRYIRNFMLVNSVIEGYRSKLMVGRFPITVLNIEADYRLVDVNAHPTKETVRISEEADLMQLIKSAISEVLMVTERIPSSLPKRFATPSEQTALQFETAAFAEQVSHDENPLHISERSVMIDATEDAWNFKLDDMIVLEGNETLEHLPFDDIGTSEPTINESVEHVAIEHNTEYSTAQKNVIKFPELHYFGQMHGTYLFAENENGLYIVDQHAAQERIKYEYYRVAIGQVVDAQQQLLVPIVLEYPTNEALLIQDRHALLAEIGIVLQPFGQNSFVIDAHPNWIKEDVETVVRDLVQMALDDQKIDLAKFREELAIMMSCKKSIKANHYLDDKQARQLLADLSQCENPYNCPHGRPVLIHLTNHDMEKMFKRIQDRG